MSVHNLDNFNNNENELDFSFKKDIKLNGSFINSNERISELNQIDVTKSIIYSNESNIFDNNLLTNKISEFQIETSNLGKNFNLNISNPKDSIFEFIGKSSIHKSCDNIGENKSISDISNKINNTSNTKLIKSKSENSNQTVLKSNNNVNQNISNNQNQINVSNLSKGIYMMMIEGDGQKISKRIIIE